MEKDEIAVELLLVNQERCQPPLPETEVLTIASSICRYAKGKKRYKPTDRGTAERLVDRHGVDLRHAPGIGWLVWDGRRWLKDKSGETLRRLKETVRDFYDDYESVDCGIPVVVEPYFRRSESNAGLNAALKVAETELSLCVSSEALDADHWLLTVGNGTLDLRTGELREPERADLLTKATQVMFVPDAASDLWQSFLDRVTGGDQELQGFLQRAVGYSLTGSTGEEKLFFAHGPAASGKSTFLEAIRAVLGEYALSADFDSFLKKGGGSIRNNIARLMGARMVVGVEVDEGEELAAGLVKQLTGGDTITARFLYKEFFEFLPQFKLWLAANDRPRVKSSDTGRWRRIIQLPFTVAIPEAERDPQVKHRLKSNPEEQSAILAWAVEGCLAWQQNGLRIPDLVHAYTQEYREENDPFTEFLQDECVLTPNATVSRSNLYQHYSTWSHANGDWNIATKVKFANALKARGVTDGGKTGTERTWRGIGLIDPEPAHSTDPF